MTTDTYDRERFYIGGEWLAPGRGRWLEIEDPATEEIFARAPLGRRDDARWALTAAREAFDHGPWPRLTPAQRAQYMKRFAVELALERSRLTELLIREAGCTRLMAEHLQVGPPIEHLSWYADRTARDPDERLPSPRSGDWLPKQTYVGGSFALEAGGRKAQLTHIANAHTDGDTWVYFADANVLSTGDTFNNLKRYQNIDYMNGGDVRGMIRALDTYIKASNDTTKIVPGHGPLATKADLTVFRDMLVTSHDRIKKLVDEGKSEEEVIAAKPLADLDATWANNPRPRGGAHARTSTTRSSGSRRNQWIVGMNDGKALRGADIVARSLARLGCARVFTLSGNHIMSIFDAAIEAKLDLVHVRHEAAAVHMADAWGRLTGEPGIALVTGGPGHANAVGALYTALGAESPMVLLSGHAATWELGRGGFQEIRQADMAAPVTKASWTATSAADARPRHRRSDPHRDSGRPGPVHLSLPSDLLEERVESNAIVWPDARRSRARRRSPTRSPTQSLAAIASRGAADHLRAARSFPMSSGRALLARLEAATQAPAVIMESPRGIADATLGAFSDLVRARRPDRAARQGARLHHQVGGGPGIRSGRAADRDRSRGRAGRARREGEWTGGCCSAASPTCAPPPRR